MVMVSYLVLGQELASITFDIYDDFTLEPIDSVSITPNNSDQTFVFEGNKTPVIELPSGVYSFQITAKNYEPYTIFDVEVNKEKAQRMEVYLTSSNADVDLNELTITASSFAKTVESPTSLRNMTSEEINRNAGANRDISKVIQSLPGVTATNSFRNDLLIRGGGPNENRFFIDGIETPVINHFATQGASGGPRGMINVDFLDNVDFYSSAFPSNRGNALSSVLDFEMREASDRKFHAKGVIGLDDMVFSADGSVGKDKNFSYLASFRASNLQLLFKALGLSFLPKYYDSTVKLHQKFKNGDQLSFLFLGAIDKFSLNDDFDRTDDNLAIWEQVPVSPQDNHTFGFNYLKKAHNGNWNFVASRNFLHNKATKYYENIEVAENLLTDYRSNEADNRLRVERKWKWKNLKMNAGLGYNFSHYYNNTFSRSVNREGVYSNYYNTSLDFGSYYGFYHLQGDLLQNNLKWSLGFRFDGNDYNNNMSNPLKQFSPRLGMAYRFAPQWYFNLSAGVYYQLPPYTAMGYQVDNGGYINEKTLQYIQASHLVAGLEYNTNQQMKITLEGYYKKYNNYPFSIRNGVNLANLGGDFGVVGIEPVSSKGYGRTYGFEFLVQQRTSSDYYGILAYTFGYSEFNNSADQYLPSSWDARHILSVTAGKEFKRNWNIGFRFRLQSPLPYTPYDEEQSQYVSVWNVTNGPTLNYDLLNTERGATANQLDVRVQKKWYFNSFNISFYVDIINVYGGSLGNKREEIYLVRDENENGIIVNPQAPYDKQIYELKSESPGRPTTLPYFGLMFEF